MAELWDNIHAIENWTQEGLEVALRLCDYLKRRAALDHDHSKALIKLNDQYKDAALVKKKTTKKAALTENGTFPEAWTEFLRQHDEDAKLGLAFSQFIEHDLVPSIKNQVKQLEADRKKCLAEIKQQKAEMKKQYDAADKAKKAYDAACKVAEEARIAFEKADKDLNVTKGQVEKLNLEAYQKAQKAEEAAEEYTKALAATNEKQEHYYTQELPKSIEGLLAVENCRIEFLTAALNRLVKIEVDGLPEKRKCFEATQASLTAVKPNDWTLEIPVPDQLRFDNYYEKNGLVSGLVKKMVGGEETLDKPLAQQRLMEVQSDLAQAEKKHAGIRTLAEAYLSQPQFADSRTLNEVNSQLDELETRIDELRLQKFKYETFLATNEGTEPPTTPTLYAENKQNSASIQLRQAALNGGSSKSSLTPSASSASLTAALQRKLSGADRLDGPPPLPTHQPRQHKQYKALYEFKGDPKNEELPFKAGDIVTVLEQDSSGWWLARDKSGTEGFVPYNYLELLD